MDRIGEVVDTASEGEYARMYGTSFTAGSLARKGARSGMRGMGNKVSPDELTEVGRMAGDEGGQEGCEWRDQIRGCGDYWYIKGIGVYEDLFKGKQNKTLNYKMK